jgi:predicted Fe-Mo cluster-binding NifX family protein
MHNALSIILRTSLKDRVSIDAETQGYGTFLDYFNSMEKIAIPHHLGRVSPVFDVARNILTICVRDGREDKREEVIVDVLDPFLRAQKVSALGVDVVVCGAISQPFEAALSAAGIEVIGFVCGPIEEVLSAALNGTLEDARFLMPGFAGPRRLRRRYGKEHR